MLLLKPLTRIVIHYLDEKNPYKKHGDLFVEIPNQENLITFEIDFSYLEILKKNYYYAYLTVNNLNLLQNLTKEILVYSSITDVYNKHQNCDIITVPLKRKPDHRKEYLKKEGILSDSKGKIEEFMVTTLSGIVSYTRDSLLLIDKD